MKINEIVNKFLLAGDKFKPKMHSRHPSSIVPVEHPLKTEETQKFKETRDSKYVHQNELDKPCFEHNMTNRENKDLQRRTASDKALNNAKDVKYDWYQRCPPSMVYEYFDKKPTLLAKKSDSGSSVKN